MKLSLCITSTVLLRLGNAAMRDRYLWMNPIPFIIYLFPNLILKLDDNVQPKYDANAPQYTSRDHQWARPNMVKLQFIGLRDIETLSFNFQPRNSIWGERSHQSQHLQRQLRQQPRPHNFTVRYIPSQRDWRIQLTLSRWVRYRFSSSIQDRTSKIIDKQD